MVLVLDGRVALLFLDRPQHRGVDEDSTLLHRLEVHVQTFDGQMGAKDILGNPRLYGAAHHLADL